MKRERVLTLAARPLEKCIIRLSFRQKTIDIAPLDKRGWLSEQPDAFRDWVAAVARWRDYDDGQIVYQAGDESDGLYGLASGGLDLSFPLVVEEAIVFYRAEIGFWIGDSAELVGHKRLISLNAAGPTRLLQLPGHEVRALLAKHPENWQYFFALSARNAHAAMILLTESLALSVRARVCRRLLVLTKTDANVEITQDALAKLVGVTRSTLRRVIHELADEGGVETGYRSLKVSNGSVLLRHVDEQ